MKLNKEQAMFLQLTRICPVRHATLIGLFIRDKHHAKLILMDTVFHTKYGFGPRFLI